MKIMGAPKFKALPIPKAKLSPMGGSQTKFQSPNPIDQGNDWQFGGPNPDQYKAQVPRNVGVTGRNPRTISPKETNRRF